MRKLSTYYPVILVKVIDFLVILVEITLGFRFILKLFGASSFAPFVNWMYSTSEPLLQPFRGMFPSPLLEQGIIFEFSTLFAMLVYMIAGWLLSELVLFVVRFRKASEEEK